MNTNSKIVIVAFLFYIFENAYFGWNQHALSNAEGFCDMVVIFLMLLSLVWSDEKWK